MQRFTPRKSFFALATVTAMALPAAAQPESYSLESRFALEPQPRLEASKPLALKSPSLSVGLSLATPFVLTNLGAGLVVLGGYPSQVNALGILGITAWALSPLTLGTGQAYAGDPQRGLKVGLGTYGAMVGGMLLGMGVAYAVAPQTMQAGGQSAGMGYAFLALPISAIVTTGYTIWAVVDAHQTAARHNEAVVNGQL
jgi:hypothetical protein